MAPKITLEQLKEQIFKASLDELGYMIGCYGGPSRLCLRDKIYDHEASKRFTQLIQREIADRMMHDILLSDEVTSE